MNFSSVSQIAMFVLSVLLIVLFIKPTFEEISVVQNDIFEYSEAFEKVATLNSQLSQLASVERSVRQSDMVALEKFLPSEFDSLQTMSDIVAIAELSNLQVTSLTSGETTESNQNVQLEGFDDEFAEQDLVDTLDYTVSLSGEYEDLKLFLSNVEQNKYILEIASLTFGSEVSSDASSQRSSSAATSEESSGSEFNVVLRTYSLSDNYRQAANPATNDPLGMDDEFII